MLFHCQRNIRCGPAVVEQIESRLFFSASMAVAGDTIMPKSGVAAQLNASVQRAAPKFSATSRLNPSAFKPQAFVTL